PPPLTRALASFAEKNGSSAFDALVALWVAFLYRTTRQGDLLVGLCEGERYSALRVALDGKTSFQELAALVRKELADGRTNALELGALLKAAHSTRIDNLFQVLVTSDKLATADARGYDLVLALPRALPKGGKGSLAGALLYDAELFDPRAAERMLGHLETLLAAALAEPGRALGGLAFLTESERRTVLGDWNDTEADFPRDKCLHELFEE